MSDNKDKNILLFSRRNGYLPAEKAIQHESLDAETRNRLWNIISLLFSNTVIPLSDKLHLMYVTIWADFFKQTSDSYPDNLTNFRNPSINDMFYSYYRSFFLSEAPWYKCFDFLEFIAKYISDEEFLKSYYIGCPNLYCFSYVFTHQTNTVLEEESSAYRFVDGIITKITSKVEIEEIDEAVGKDEDPVSDHLEKALRFLSDRQNPDYKNSIKESISAVEAQCCIILEDPNATLGDALSRLAKKYSLHPALKEGFQKLYGFTSNAGGIRHGNADDTEVDYSLAKYMLVSCSAFINYLRSLPNQAES